MNPMDRQELLAEIKRRLTAAHGDRLRGIVLYGSQARGDARWDSDIDLLVLLEDPVDCWRDLERNIEALYPLSSALNRRISPKPVSSAEYETIDCPLFRNARREGVVV